MQNADSFFLFQMWDIALATQNTPSPFVKRQYYYFFVIGHAFVESCIHCPEHFGETVG